MKFKEGTKVFTADGQQVGNISRVVLDPHTKEVTHVVVNKGFLFTQEKVVPISLIGAATDERVTLRDDAGDLQSLPDFVETHYVLVEEENTASREDEHATSLYWYPPVGMMWRQPGGYLGDTTYFGYPIPSYVIETERNIPTDTVPLKEGAKVISSDGTHVGNVEAILTEPKGNRATHLVLSQGLIFKEKKLVPTVWISEVKADEVHLEMGSRLLNELREYQPQG
jgi:uncharacterized protein YrrD